MTADNACVVVVGEISPILVGVVVVGSIRGVDNTAPVAVKTEIMLAAIVSRFRLEND